MIWCVRCRRLVPEGQYCPWCLGSWNVAICQGCGHHNVPSVPACTKCANLSLSVPAVGIRLGWVITLICFLLFIGFLRLVFNHLATILQWSESIALLGMSAATGHSPCWIKNCFWEILTIIFVIAPLLGAMLKTWPGRGGIIGEWLRGLPVKALLITLRLSQHCLVLLWRGVLRLFFARNADASTRTARTPRKREGE